MTDLLPLPSPWIASISKEQMFDVEQTKSYARANVARAAAAKDAEIARERWLREQAENRCVAVEDQREELRAEVEAIRTLMDIYNLGGWTDAVEPMKRALAAEARADMLEVRLATLNEKLKFRQELIEAQSAEIEELRAKTALTMGVGTGDGKLFVHGDYESIKAAQEIVLERDALRAEVKGLTALHAQYVLFLADEKERAERLAEALQWYAEHVRDCRKLGRGGDEARSALDSDGGKRARVALEQEEINEHPTTKY